MLEYWPQWIIGFLLGFQFVKVIMRCSRQQPDTVSKIAASFGGCSYWAVFTLILGLGGFWAA